MPKKKNYYKAKYRRNKKEEDLLQNVVEVYFSDNHLIELNKLIKLSKNVSLSSFVREASLKAVIIENNKPSITDQHSLGQLKRIGNNINQILKQINTFKKDSYFQQHVKDLQGFMDELREEFKKFES